MPKRLLSSLLIPCAGLAFASGADATPPPLPPVTAVHAAAGGVVAVDEATVTYHRGGTVSPLASFPYPAFGLPQQLVAGNGRWVAARGSSGIDAGMPPAALTPVPTGGSAGPAGCKGWQADPAHTNTFAVVDRMLVVPGEGRCIGQAAGAMAPRASARAAGTSATALRASAHTADTMSTDAPAPTTVPTPPTTVAPPAITPPLPTAPTATPTSPPTPRGRRPLFARTLPDGHWRVLRWLPASAAKAQIELASAGRLLAIGVAPTSGGDMPAQVIDVTTGAIRFRTTLPPSRLALDTDGTLVATTLQGVGPGTTAAPRILLATPKAPKPRVLVSDVGSNTTDAPAAVVAGGRVAYETGGPLGGFQSLDVISVHGGTPRTIASFRPYLSQLLGFDLRGSRLTWMHSEEITPATFQCYAPPQQTPRRLQTVDLARAVAPIPAPPEPAPVDPSLYARCGPPPPVAAGASARVP